MTRILIAVACVGAFALGVAIKPVLFPQASPFDPLYLPDQSVLNRVAGVAGPAILYGDDLDVVGTKCNKTKDAVSLRSIRRWSSEEPPGTIVPDAAAVGKLPAGCVTARFSNPVSAAVLEADRHLRARGMHPTWRLTAALTPEGKNVVVRSWRTEPFELVPR